MTLSSVSSGDASSSYVPSCSMIYAEDSARGATLTEYALILSLVVVTMIAAVDFLTSSGGQLLDDVGDDISNPREYKNIVVETPLTPPPPWVPTTVPSTILTWVDRPLGTAEGCIAVTGADLGIVPCGSPTVTPFNGLSDDGQVSEISLVDGSGCMSGDDSGPSPVVTIQPCGGPGQVWREVSTSGDSVTYTHEASGLCLQTIVPAAPSPLTMAACDGSAGQFIEVQF